MYILLKGIARDTWLPLGSVVFKFACRIFEECRYCGKRWRLNPTCYNELEKPKWLEVFAGLIVCKLLVVLCTGLVERGMEIPSSASYSGI